MNTIKNNLKKLDLTNLIGLLFASSIIVPTLLFLVTEIFNGSFNNW